VLEAAGFGIVLGIEVAREMGGVDPGAQTTPRLIGKAIGHRR